MDPRSAVPLTHDAQAWRNAWRQARRRSPATLRERHGTAAQLDEWSRRAASYAEHGDSEASRGRRERILTWLEEQEALVPSARVLDIGAGPGNYAVSLAGKAAHVVALEPAEGMCRLLRERIHRQGIRNVEVVQDRWEQIDLAGRRWRGAFDLVFASMSPGVFSPETLEKMLACSRRWCYLSGWSGELWGRWGLAQAELWPLLFGEPLGDYPSDVLYPFGLLYALGHRPALRFQRSAVRLQMPPPEATRALAEHFARYAEVDAAKRRIIAQYVARHSTEGTFRQEFHTCQGLLLWQIEGGKKPT